MQAPLPRVVAPFVLALLCLVLGAIASVGVIFLAIAIVDGLGPPTESRVANFLYNSVLFLSLPLSFWTFRNASAWFYRREGHTRSRLLAHFGHCLALYALVGWKVYAEATCVGVEPPIPGRCADLFGTFLTLALVALGGIVGDAFAIKQEVIRVGSPPS